jgi:hypothetical protein
MQGAIQRRWLSLLVMAFLLVGWQLLNPSPVKKRQNIPKAPEEAIEPLKRAYAAWKQGHYEQAIQIAKAIYERYGEVYAVWWPTWARRIYGQLPDPEDVESVAERGLYLVLRGTTPGQILGFACYEAGRYEEAIAWGKAIGSWGIRWLAEQGMKRKGKVVVMPPKHTWRPLPLRFREEDYFILVPLDEACKILGLPCTITTNPKMAGGKGIRIVKPDAPNIVYRLFLGRPLVERLEGGKGQTETIAYAPYEEDGVVWVPFYWLAKQAGIRWWEVRDGKIYVAPK